MTLRCIFCDVLTMLLCSNAIALEASSVAALAKSQDHQVLGVGILPNREAQTFQQEKAGIRQGPGVAPQSNSLYIIRRSSRRHQSLLVNQHEVSEAGNDPLDEVSTTAPMTLTTTLYVDPAKAEPPVGGRSSFVICSAVSSTLLCLLWTLGDCFTSPLPWRADEAQLEAELDKTLALETTLSKGLARERMLAASTAEVPEGLTPEEMQALVEAKQKEVEEQADRVADEIDAQAGRAQEKAQEAIKKAEAVQAVFSTEFPAIRGRADAFAQGEIDDVFKKVNEAAKTVPVEDLVPKSAAEAMDKAKEAHMESKERSEALDDDDKAQNVEAAPVALVLAGFLAPTQLHALAHSLGATMLFNIVMIAIGGAICWKERDEDCGDKRKMEWLEGFLTIQVVYIISSFLAKGAANGALTYLESKQDQSEQVGETGIQPIDQFLQVSSNLIDGYRALVSYDEVASSWTVFFSKLATLVITGWGAYAMVIVIQKMGLEDDKCAITWFIDIYVFLYVFSLPWTLLSLLVWFVTFFGNWSCVQTCVMRSARSMDGGGPAPMFQTLVRAFLLRDACGLLKVQQKVIDKDIQRLQKKLQSANEDMEKNQLLKQAMEKMEAEPPLTEAELMKKYEKQIEDLLKSTEPMVNVLATLDKKSIDKMKAKSKQVAEKAQKQAEKKQKQMSNSEEVSR